MGAVALSRVEVVGLLRDGDRVVGAELLRTETAERLQVRAKVVISATGVWTQQFGRLAQPDAPLRLHPSKGVHLVVPRSCVNSTMALILPTEKSVLFVLPWGDHWLIGTTDTSWREGQAPVAVCSADIEYLLATVNSWLGGDIGRGDIEATYAGLRPLIAGPDEATTRLSREHAVNCPVPGLVLISGGKYTTYRVMAKDAVNAAVGHARLVAGPSQTEDLLLVGAVGLGAVREQAEPLGRKSGLPLGQVVRLVGRYGSLVQEVLEEAAEDASLLLPIAGGGGYLRVEASYAVTHEGARHLEDVLRRRTRIAIETRDRGVVASFEVARVMAPRLGWDEGTADAEIASYAALVEAETLAEEQPDDQAASASIRAVEPFLAVP
jgi:glycerol-3-phosphate dehydrogenase